MDVPLVSVVIPAYNVSRYVRESVDSALGQTHPAMQVIVVNDGSTDDTGAVLAAYGDRIVYHGQENQGLSAARNAGLRLATGEYIAFLDSDDAWLPEKTAAQLAVFARSAEVGLVSCPYLVMNQESVVEGEVRGQHSAGETDLCELLLGNTVGSPSCVMLRRACLDRVGFFDETLVNGSEDWDYYLRVVLASFRIDFADQPLAKYRVLASSMSSAKNADRMLGNELRVLEKAFADPRLRGEWRLRRRAFSARHLAAAWHYIDAGSERLPDLRAATLRSFLCYPPDFVDRSRLMVALHAILGPERFEGLKAPLRRLRRLRPPLLGKAGRLSQRERRS